MSYDLYCYKSQLGKPDLEEAQNVVEIAEDNDNEVEADPDTKFKIATALTDFNPRLQRFEFNHEEIVAQKGMSFAEAKKNFDHIELNSPEEDLATQITIFDNYVSITVPYWYSGNDAEVVFKKVMGYAKIIHETAGYFVYDPQTENVYDPLIRDFEGFVVYESMTKDVEVSMNEQTKTDEKKSWWKFW